MGLRIGWLKKPTELGITVLATLGLDMPIKMLALAVEVIEASQREFIMAFDGTVTAPIAWSRGARALERLRIDLVRWIRHDDPGGRYRTAAFDDRCGLRPSRGRAVAAGPEYLTKYAPAMTICSHTAAKCARPARPIAIRKL
jgi:hypothetical protein